MKNVRSLDAQHPALVTAFEFAKKKKSFGGTEKTKHIKDAAATKKKKEISFFALFFSLLSSTFNLLPFDPTVFNLTSASHHVRDSKEEEAHLPHLSFDKMEEE